MRAFNLVLLSSFAAPAFAHPGEHHAGLLATVWHMATQPDHLTMLLIAVVAGTAGAIFLGKRAK